MKKLLLVLLIFVFTFVNISTTYPEEPEMTLDQPEQLYTINYTYLGEFVCTAYCDCKKCCGPWSGLGKTASGADYIAGETIAVDPSIIPYGSIIYIEMPDTNVYRYIASDTGSAIKGNRIDISMSTHQEALNFGRKTLKIYLCEEEII